MPPNGWSKEMMELISKFELLEPAKDPFDLRSGCRVIDPAKFHASLADEIKCGPIGPRVLLGSLKEDLKDYLARRT